MDEEPTLGPLQNPSRAKQETGPSISEDLSSYARSELKFDSGSPLELPDQRNGNSKTAYDGLNLFNWLVSGKDPLKFTVPSLESLLKDESFLCVLRDFQEKFRSGVLSTNSPITYECAQSLKSDRPEVHLPKQADFARKINQEELWRKEFVWHLRSYLTLNTAENEYILDILLKLIRDLESSRTTNVPLESILSQVRYADHELINQDEMNQKIRHDSEIYLKMHFFQEALERSDFVHYDKTLEVQREPAVPLTHWDHLIQEAIYIQKAAQSWSKYRKYTRIRTIRGIKSYWQTFNQDKYRKLEDDVTLAKRRAAFVAREVKRFWKGIKKIIDHKIRLYDDIKMMKEREKNLDVLVHQTEKYSAMLSENLSIMPRFHEDHDENGFGNVQTQTSLLDSRFKPNENAKFKQLASFTENEPRTENIYPHRKLIESPNQGNGLKPDEFSNSSSPITVLSQGDVGHDTLKRKNSLNDIGSKKLLRLAGDEIESFNVESPANFNTSPIDYRYMQPHVTESELLQDKYEDRSQSVIKDRPGENLTDRIHESTESIQYRHGIDLQVIDKYEPRYDDSVSDGTFPNTRSSFLDDSLPLEVSLKSQKTEKTTSQGQDVCSFVNHTVNLAAKQAKEIQPTGNTLATSSVRIRQPFLLKHELREYQLVGLNWLSTMYDRHLNGILADEMGLGKTIQTIALLAHLACEKAIWGPHLVVVPTSVMLNWEMEFKKWCPAFKILNYFGTSKERRLKRSGWSKTNAFHVCITSYKLVLQDHLAFRRKKWFYFILDEAQNIKNFRSQRWQKLLHFNSERRLLLTGTPLQNSLMELWSLMHFLMPYVFTSRKDFQEWFSSPVMDMIEGGASVNEGLIQRLHAILRPFILRRLKSEVEQQLPHKYEHLVMCRLSKRQSYLYDEFISRTQTQECLASGNFLGIINCLMQLRKVCNHPDLFETRQVISPFVLRSKSTEIWKNLPHNLARPLYSMPHPKYMELIGHMKYALSDIQYIEKPENCITFVTNDCLLGQGNTYLYRTNNSISYQEETCEMDYSFLLADRNRKRSNISSLCTADLIEQVSNPYREEHAKTKFHSMEHLLSISHDMLEKELGEILKRFVLFIHPALAIFDSTQKFLPDNTLEHLERVESQESSLNTLSAIGEVNQLLSFPDLRLVEYDCGKLQTLNFLLHELLRGGHRVLIFTQMSRMLDILEIFMNYHGFKYLRLDGTTKIEHRQVLMEKFNTDTRIFAFILSTRSGGIGVNLTGADTVIFYDSDWNPSMDAQAQDRCHRIGQTKDVHIYRLICEHTIEENILKKATNKRVLDELVIQGGEFTVEHFLRSDNWKDLLLPSKATRNSPSKFEGMAYQSQTTPIELENALLQAEETCDIEALNRAKKEILEENLDFRDDFNETDLTPQLPTDDGEHVTKLPILELESSLSPVQRLALGVLGRNIYITETGNLDLVF